MNVVFTPSISIAYFEKIGQLYAEKYQHFKMTCSKIDSSHNLELFDFSFAVVIIN